MTAGKGSKYREFPDISGRITCIGLHVHRHYYILQPIDDKIKWQKVLYQKIGSSGSQYNQQRVIDRILSMAKVMTGLHMVSCSSNVIYFHVLIKK